MSHKPLIQIRAPGEIDVCPGCKMTGGKHIVVIDNDLESCPFRPRTKLEMKRAYAADRMIKDYKPWQHQQTFSE